MSENSRYQIGQYEIVEKIGQGGMGAVYKCRHQQLQKVVALKILIPEQTHNLSSVERFKREMRASGLLEHENIVQALDAGEHNGVYYLAMELVEGVDLATAISRDGPLSIPDACEAVRQVAIGLQHAHEHGLVHRDIKPSNLILGLDGRVQILDMGLALLDRFRSPAGEELTVEGQVMGTVNYMAPEQAIDSRRVDIRADIFSLGATLFKLLSGHAPFTVHTHEAPLNVLTALANQSAPSIAEVCAQLPAGLTEVVDRMLSREPMDRFQTPQDVARELSRFTAGSHLPLLAARLVNARSKQPAKLSIDGDPLLAKLLADTQVAEATMADSRMSQVTIRGDDAVARMRQKAKQSRTKSWTLGGLTAASALVVVGALFFLLSRSDGTLTIELGEGVVADEVVVAVEGNGVQERFDFSRGWRARLAEGVYRLKLVVGDDNYRVRTETVAIQEGQLHRVLVEYRPITREIERTVDRIAAEYVFSRGGRVTIQSAGPETQMARLEDLPDWSFQLTAVELTGDSITDEDLSSLRNLAWIRSAKVGGPLITNDGLRHLTTLPNLSLLWLASNGQINDECVQYLQAMPKLANLSLVGSSVGDLGLEQLVNVKFYALYLSGTRITDNGVRFLLKCPNLRELHLNDTAVTDVSLEHLAELKILSLLHAARTVITDRGVAHLPRLASLADLNLTQTRITDRSLSILQESKALRVLSIRQTEVSTEACRAFREQVPGCELLR